MSGYQPAQDNAAPMLSAVLPNYNHGRYLPRALDALLRQSRPPDEIVVIDDASTDDSREIIARYAEKYPSIRPVLNEKNIGVIATLNRGLDAARGTYIHFGAADDFVMPGFFSTGLTALQAHPRAGLFCGETALIDGNSGKPLGVRPPVPLQFRPGFVSAAMFERHLRHNDNFILTGAALLRRDAVVSAGGFDENLSTFADGYLVRKIAFTDGVYYAPQVCLTWCIFGDSVSRTTSTNVERAKEVFQSVRSRMSADPTFPAWYGETFSRRWRFSICRLAVETSPINVAVLDDMGAHGKTGRMLTSWAAANLGERAARLIILAWLWSCLRPYSLTSLVAAAVVRRWRSAPGEPKAG